MRIDFSATRLHSIQHNRNIRQEAINDVSKSIGNSERLGPIVRVSFGSDFNKNAKQFISIAAEDKGLGFKEYDKGGLAVVIKDANESWNKTLGADARVILPYHAPNNPNGNIKVLKNVRYDKNGKQILFADASEIKTVPLDYRLNKGETFILQSIPDADGVSKYLPIEKLDVDGFVKAFARGSLDIIDEPYQLFQIKNPNASKNEVTRYIMHTRHLSSVAESYGYSPDFVNIKASGKNTKADILYSIHNRAVIDALPKLNTEKYGFFNPANIWLHDRQAFSSLIDMSDRSNAGELYYNGLRMHSTFHNAGRDYQGVINDPLEFFRIVATNRSIAELEIHPRYDELKEIEARRLANRMTKEDIKVAKEILNDVISPYIDKLGSYNVTKIALNGAKINSLNMTCGTVSLNYGQEARSANTSEMALGLTDDFANTRTINITNGANVASLKLDDPNANFGWGKNGLSANKSTFKTFECDNLGKIVMTPKDVVATKKANSKWLLDLIGNADTKKNKDALLDLFFDSTQKKESSILGQLSPYKDGDILLMGWGRPAPQKGLPTTIEGFLKFLQDDTIPQDVKLKTKLLAGAGSWNESARDWKNIQKFVREIQTLDGGKYFNNVMYVNGFFPNRLAACATYSIFTSVFEPCGIAPLESYGAATPVISTNTGGAPNFVKSLSSSTGVVTDETGFLSKNPYLLNPDYSGFSYTQEEKVQMAKDKNFDIKWRIVDNKRRELASEEIYNCIKKAVFLDAESYEKMVANTMKQKTGWHENSEYNIDVQSKKLISSTVDNKPINNSLSANGRYMGEVFEVVIGEDGKLTGAFSKERYTKQLKRMSGFGERLSQVQKESEILASAKATKWGKIVTASALSLIAVGTGIMLYLNKYKNALAGCGSIQQTSNIFNKIA